MASGRGVGGAPSAPAMASHEWIASLQQAAVVPFSSSGETMLGIGLMLACGQDNALVVFVENDTAAPTASNTPPQVTRLDLGPAPTTDGVIAPVIEASDADGDDVHLALRWSINGMPIDHTGETLDGTDWFDRDDIILLVVTPSDGTALGESVASEPLTVLNSPPTAPEITLTPEDPEAGIDGLSCAVVVSAEDADGDSVTHTIDWSRDGVAWPDEAVPGEETRAGEVWTCTVTPSDGTDSGEVASDWVTIEDSPIPAACPDGNCALRFDGVDDYVEVAHADALSISTDGLTVEAWVYFDVLKGNCMTVVRKGTTESASFEYWLHKNWAPEDSLYWGSWPAWTVVDFEALSPQVWHHYAGVYDPVLDEARVYLDGEERTTATLSSTVEAGTEGLRIGIDWDLGCAMDGVIDEVRISLGARYTEGFTPQMTFTTDADTLALYHLDAYTGTTAYDHSSLGHHGTIIGAQWTTESP